jgi:hypothetical protein
VTTPERKEEEEKEKKKQRTSQEISRKINNIVLAGKLKSEPSEKVLKKSDCCDRL